MRPIIRLATPNDAEQIGIIYNPIIATTAISFEVEPLTVDVLQQRVRKTLECWPWLVCEQGGEIRGYAYASQHHERIAYQWSVDVSVYIHPEARRAGVGCALYRSLFAILILQGFYNAYAGITLPNPASVGLHESLGFRPVGVYSAVGFKLGAWHDVGWWQLSLCDLSAPAQAPVNLSAVQASASWPAALATGLSRLRL